MVEKAVTPTGWAKCAFIVVGILLIVWMTSAIVNATVRVPDVTVEPTWVER
jgi:hypothetical protein